MGASSWSLISSLHFACPMMATCFNKARAVGVATMAVGVLFYWVHCFCTINILLYKFKLNASYHLFDLPGPSTGAGSLKTDDPFSASFDRVPDLFPTLHAALWTLHHFSMWTLQLCR